MSAIVGLLRKLAAPLRRRRCSIDEDQGRHRWDMWTGQPLDDGEMGRR